MPNGAARPPAPAIRRETSRRRAVARVATKAVPHLVVVVVMPTVCFLAGCHWWGLAGGVGLALTWNLGGQTVRWARGQPLSAVLFLGLGGLLLRSLLAVTFHSARMYFLVPAVFTAGTAMAYIASAFTPTPLVARIVGEFVPESFLTEHEHIRNGLLRKGTLFYGVEQLLSAVISMAMVYRMSTTAYAAIHPVVSWLILAGCVLLALPLFRREVALVARTISSQHPFNPRPHQCPT